jgi:hypothetical protein
MLTSDGPVDGVLVYHEDLSTGSTIGSWWKTLLGNTPVVLISTGWETMAPWFGIDAVCYTNSLDAEMARIIAMLFRDLLIEEPHPANVSLELRDPPLRPFVVRPRQHLPGMRPLFQADLPDPST